MTDQSTDRSAVTLRPATPADAEAIAALFTDEGYPAGPSDIVERLGRFGSAHSRVVVAEHDGGDARLHRRPRACPASSTTTGSCGSSRSSWTPAPASAGSGGP